MCYHDNNLQGLVLYVSCGGKFPEPLEIDGIQSTEGVLQLPGDGSEQRALDWSLVPALVNEIVNRSRNTLWHLQETPTHNVFGHLCVRAIRIGVLPKREDLPEKDAKGPGVGVWGELSVLERLGGQPAEGDRGGLATATDDAVVL